MVRLNIYTKAFLISAGIFVVGIFIGMNVEKFVTSDFASRTRYVEESVQEIELEMLYFQSLDETYSCNFLGEIVRRTNNNLDELSEQLSRYSETNVLFSGADVENLKKRYTSLLIKDWILQERIKEICGDKTVTMLYFYDRKGCDDCLIQGNILSILKNSFREKVMIFPLDRKVDLSMIEILMNRFNVTSVPSLVIEEKTYSGIVVGEKLKRIACDILNENISICL